jgi:hypothetical protein
MAENKEPEEAQKSGPPAPEVLKSQSDSTPTVSTPVPGRKQKIDPKRLRGTYRPSHKATFIGLGVVVGILIINVVVISFFMNNNTATENASQTEVTLSTESLNKIGVSRNPVGDSGEQLSIGPNTKFTGTVTVLNGLSVAGQFKLNSRFSADDASITNLQAGNTSLSQLNVNGDGTVSSLNLRNNLAVVGTSTLQGPVTIGQLLTVNNNLNVIGSLSIGGALTVRSIQAVDLTSNTTLTVGGHIITGGAAPGVSAGGALGSNGTISISGNDIAGSVGANIGVGASAGLIAQVSFRNAYGSTPRVIVTVVGKGANGLYINRNANGFSINVSSALSPGGYAFDYIVMQ